MSFDDGQETRPVRIALISYAHSEPFHVAQMDVAQAHLTTLGYRQGTRAEYRRYFGDRDLHLTASHAREIVDWDADVVLSFMTNADIALLAATKQKRIPIICWSMDPVGAGLAQSETAPGGNLTGVTISPPLQWWQVRCLKALMPDLRQIAHFFNGGYAIAPSAFEHLKRAAAMFEIEVRLYECESTDALVPAVARIAQDGIEALVVGPHELFNANGNLISATAIRHGIAAVGLASIGENEGVAGFMPDFERIWRSAADLADRVLRGEDPAAMPFDRHIKPLFTINLGAIARLGLSAPPWLVAEADRVLSNGQPMVELR